MKKRLFPRRAFLCFLCLALTAALLCGCTALRRPAAAILGTEDTAGVWPGIAVPQLTEAASRAGFEIAADSGSAGDIAALAQEYRLGAVIAQLDDAAQAQAYLDAAAPLGLPVFFCGERPADSVMAGYDKCWYIGGNPVKQGEQLGETLLAAWQDGRIADANGDRRVQVVLLTAGADSDPRADAALRIFENRGVYSDLLTVLPIPADTAEPAALLTAELSQLPQTELILAATPALAQAAADGSTLPLACLSAQSVPAALAANPRLLADLPFDQSAAAQLLAQFAHNAALGRDPTDGTGVRLDTARGALLDYGAAVSSPDESAASVTSASASPASDNTSGG